MPMMLFALALSRRWIPASKAMGVCISSGCSSEKSRPRDVYSTQRPHDGVYLRLARCSASKRLNGPQVSQHRLREIERRTRLAARQKWSETKRVVWVVCPPPCCRATWHAVRSDAWWIACYWFGKLAATRSVCSYFTATSCPTVSGRLAVRCHAFFTALCLASEKAVSRAFA